ncbi:MAG: autotransporter outer membrane beta-barrel domain-containing protein [Acidobacteriota bacterium]|jgi:uncharacterized protein YhjY with autotransporter beta-barrel domain
MTNHGRFLATLGRRPGLAALAVALLLGVGVSHPALAQSLNDQYVRLLSNNCEGLLGPNGTPGRVEFGPNLFNICTIPATGSGSAAGGGSASVRSSVNSVQNTVLQRRLDRARGNQPPGGGGGGGGTAPSPWATWEPGAEVSLVTSTPTWEADGGGGHGDLLSRRWDVFASLGYESLDRTVTDFEDGYSSGIGGITVGFDYRFADWVVAGLLLTYSNQDGDFDGGGDFDITSLIPTLYASFLPSDRSFVQVVLGRSSQSSDVQRNVQLVLQSADPSGFRIASGMPSSSVDGTVDLAGAQGGYDFSSGRFTYGPRAAVNYSKTDVDAYVEDGSSGLELQVTNQSVKSVQGVLGFFGSWALSSKRGVFLPQLNVEYVREFEDVPDVLNAQFVEDLRGPDATVFPYQTNTPDSDFFNVEVGFSAVLANGIQPYVTLRGMFGNDLFDSYAINAGVRFEL